MFWDLTKADYKSEIYKIITDASYYLKQNHKEFFCDQITQAAAAKLDNADFDLLSEIGKYN